MNWTSYAAELASRITHPTSPWAPFVESVPRHQLVSRWWRPTSESLDGPSWELVDDSRCTRWPAQAYEDRTYVTQVDMVRADLAVPGDRATGKVTSSSTAPGTLVRLLDHARLVGGADVLYVGIGTGYGCALVAARLGGQTSPASTSTRLLVTHAGPDHAGSSSHRDGRFTRLPDRHPRFRLLRTPLRRLPSARRISGLRLRQGGR